VSGVKRAGPPLAVQKVREGVYVVQVLLSEAPSADWKRLFYDAQHQPPPDFPPRAVEISGAVLRFRSEAQSVERKVAWIDQWVERANEKEARLAPRSEEERRRREDIAQERRELAELNVGWSKL